MHDLVAQPLTSAAFAAFGEVLEAGGDFRLINDGMCRRHHDRAALDFGPEGRAGISVFDAQPRALPYVFDLVERHPDGSQAFVPMTRKPFLVIVAPDDAGKPGDPQAFLTSGEQGINLRRGTWHGVLTPLDRPADFLVVDREGEGVNLEEVTIAPVIITA